MKESTVFQKILVATDFSPHSEAALKQAIWLARRSKARIVLAHVIPDLRQSLLLLSPDAGKDMFAGEGDQLQRQSDAESESRMQALVAKVQAGDLGIECETLLGDPWIALTQAVQREKYDLVLVGAKGHSGWEKFLIGSTTKRLIRSCPTAVWNVNANHDVAPKVVLAATDFSEVSRKAAFAGRQIAKQSGAEFHLLHVIDSSDIPEGVIGRLAPNGVVNAEINEIATNRMKQFVKSLDIDPVLVHSHLSWGIPSEEIARATADLKTDLLALGTIGRKGISGILLGNTAERLLEICTCGILTVKPDGFNSPIS